MKTKKILLAVTIIVVATNSFKNSYAQWTNSTDIYNTNTGEVGIGNTAPEHLLDILNSTTARSLNVKSTYSGTAEKYGIYNYVTNAGSGARNGIFSLLEAPNSNKSAHGIYSKVTHQGSGAAYGVRSYVNITGTGVHYGIHSEATGSNNYAFYGLGRGYFSDRVGIGQSSPGARLTVNSSAGEKPLWISIDGSTKMMIATNGGTSLGFTSGATPPENGLIVSGQTAIGISTADSRLRVAASAGEKALWVSIDGDTKLMQDSNGGISIGYPSGVIPPADGLVVDGKVIINSESGAYGYELSVDGEVICEELRVMDSGSWPDYVFTENYRLLTLEEVEDHIKSKKHLPGIPSSSEVEENGINVGQMQKMMMEKIEELTLYVIELKKCNTELTNRIAQVEGE